LSLRAAFVLLLLANLAFFGWAHLVDVPSEPLPDDSIQHLPKLKLLNEVQISAGTGEGSAPAGPAASSAARRAATPRAIAPGAPPAAAASSQTPTGAAALLARNSSGVPSAQRCVTVGPFNDPERVDQAADLLKERGFKLRKRTAQSPEVGYWVYVGDLKSDTDQSAVVRRLRQNGISDAHVMPDSDKGRRVSVGFFTERDGAERRARAVRGLGLHADIDKRTQSAAAHWVDVDLDSSTQSLPAEGLLSLEEVGSRLEIKECPTDARVTSSGEPQPALR